MMVELARFLSLLLVASSAGGAMIHPDGFREEKIARPDGKKWNHLVGLTFEDKNENSNDEARGFAWERTGVCWIIDPKNPVKEPFLDISEEVLAWRDFGLLGFAVDPNFEQNGYVYLLYNVDRHFLDNCREKRNGGEPDCNNKYSPNKSLLKMRATIGRITRYQALKPEGEKNYKNAIKVDYNSRQILMGATPETGSIIMHQSHGVGSLCFGEDGTLLASIGDGASYKGIDVGSADTTAFKEALNLDIITKEENVGAYRSQMIHSYSGKIIRISPTDGAGIPSNPFYNRDDPFSAASKVWTLGLRNPCRISIVPDTGSHRPDDGNPGVIHVGDVGMSTWESWFVIDEKGQNCGWPVYEGMTKHEKYVKNAPKAFKNWKVRNHNPPRLDWHHDMKQTRYSYFPSKNSNNFEVVNVGEETSNGEVAVKGQMFAGNAAIGGFQYTGTDFPNQYRNNYFMGDFGGQWIKFVELDNDFFPKAVKPFISNAGGVVSLTTHPSKGHLYYVSWEYGLFMVTYGRNQNQLPVAVATARPVPRTMEQMKYDKQVYGQSPLQLKFKSTGSRDPDGGNLKYLWDFGDGETSNKRNPRHTYKAATNKPETFIATLTVSDPRRETAVSKVLVSVNNSPPKVGITSPVPESLYSLKVDLPTQKLRAIISDNEDSRNQLKCEWQTVLHHDNHVHTEPVVHKCKTKVQTLAVGCGQDTFWWSFTLKVTDRYGLSTTKVSKIYPDCSEGIRKEDH